MAETWTITQAALIVEKPLAALRKAVERIPVEPKPIRRGDRTVRAFDLHDLVFLQALDDLKRDLTEQKQAEVYRALMRLPHHAPINEVEAGQVRYDFDPYLRIVRSRIDATEQLMALIDTSGPEPTIKDTTIEVYRIAALLEEMSVAEILADYPSLDVRRVRAAEVFAEGNPREGFSYPKTTAKKAMREMRAADADAFLPTRE